MSFISCDFPNLNKESQPTDSESDNSEFDEIMAIEMNLDPRLAKFHKLIEKEPNNPKGYYKLGTVLQLGDEAAIISNYKKAFELYLQDKKSISDIGKEDFLKSMGVEDIYFAKSDLDNDGQFELLLTKLDGSDIRHAFIIDKIDNELGFHAIEDIGDYFLEVHIIDMNNNGLKDILLFGISSGSGGARNFSIYEYNNGLVKHVGQSSWEKYYHVNAEIIIEDVDSDGLKEIIFPFYLDLDEGSWKVIEYYKWDGEKYTVFKEEKFPH